MLPGRLQSVIHRRVLIVSIYLFVFATGAAGLIYEVVWQRYLSRFLGSDTMATAIIIGTFLGGLSLGYFLCGKLSAYVKNHFKAYAALEATIAVWCMSFPTLFEAFSWVSKSWSFGSPFLAIVQGVASSFILTGVPTVCMGATVPMLTRGVSSNALEATSVHAKIYGVNTAGGFLGTIFAGFWLIPEVGLQLTILRTSLLNLGAAAFFYLISRIQYAQEANDGEPAPQDDAAIGESSRQPVTPRLFLYAIAFMSGVYVMTLENVLIRISNLSFGSSTYSFSIVLSVFLLSIAVGSHIVGRFKNIPRSLLFYNQLVLAVSLLLVYLTLDKWPYLAHIVRISFQSNKAGFAHYYLSTFIVLSVMLIVPLSFAGATIPIAFHYLKRELGTVGRYSGLLLSWNTIGNLIGSIVGGIVLFYFIDCPDVFLTAVTLAAVSAMLASKKLSRWHVGASAAVLAISLSFVAATPWYDTNRLSVGTFRTQTAKPYSFEPIDKFYIGFNKEFGFRTISYDDDPTGAVAVIEIFGKGNRPDSKAIFVNGKNDSNTWGDLYTLKLSAHIPALLAKKREKAFVVGVGTGVTLGELSLYPEFKEIEVAEISPGVVDALHYFDDSNNRVRSDPRLKISIGDAFRVLKQSEGQWDVIISEPSNPWVTGVDSLFSSDFYEIVKQRLAPDGVFLQWAHVYSSSYEMIGMIANTLRRSFDEIHTFRAASGDLFFMARKEHFTGSDLERAEQVFKKADKARRSLAELDIESFDGILVREIWSPTLISDTFSTYGIQTLDNPRLHFMAGRSFFYGENLSFKELFPTTSSFYSNEYLLARRYPDWKNRALSHDEIESLYQSTKVQLNEKPTISGELLKLKAYLSDPNSNPLSPDDRRELGSDLIPLISGSAPDIDAFFSSGLDASRLMARIQAMVGQVNVIRSWIAPYPIEGLKKILREFSVSRQIPVYDRNWCMLQLVRFLILERANIAELKELLDIGAKDGDGRLILSEEGAALAKTVNDLMRERGIKMRVDRIALVGSI